MEIGVCLFVESCQQFFSIVHAAFLSICRFSFEDISRRFMDFLFISSSKAVYKLSKKMYAKAVAVLSDDKEGHGGQK